MESDKDFKDVRSCVLVRCVVAEAVFVMQVWLQVLVQSIEPSLSSENVVIAGGGLTDAEAAPTDAEAALAKAKAVAAKLAADPKAVAAKLAAAAKAAPHLGKVAPPN
jgi:hypothetical protein